MFGPFFNDNGKNSGKLIVFIILIKCLWCVHHHNKSRTHTILFTLYLLMIFVIDFTYGWIECPYPMHVHSICADARIDTEYLKTLICSSLGRYFVWRYEWGTVKQPLRRRHKKTSSKWEIHFISFRNGFSVKNHLNNSWWPTL